MDKHGKPPKKAQPKQPAESTGTAASPNENSNAGGKKASPDPSRKPAGRGSARGR